MEFMQILFFGFVYSQNRGIWIDAGLEIEGMKKGKKLDEEQLPLTHLFITHAHVDHFEGAAYL
jgi:glyoxylase-like metal-dependent hydrolase (beta-lactamase superfamily II)